MAENCQAALDRSEEINVRLKKARVLGWEKKYEASIKEYQKILEKEEIKKVRLEMESKEAYWNKKVKQAIKAYGPLLEIEPKNLEARFDLSQIYCYQNMWEEAERENKEIIAISPEHFRAKEALKKIELIAQHISLNSGYDFFQAESDDRNTDIKRHLFFNNLKIPLTYRLFLDLNYNHTLRKFSDWDDLKENKLGFNIFYFKRPDFNLSFFYNFLKYNQEIKSCDLYGADINIRILDRGELLLKYAKENLVNSSTVIRERYYADNFVINLSADLNRKLRIGLNYLYSCISDDNIKNEPEIYLAYYFSLEPKRFYIQYRYKYQSFDKEVLEYFSPGSFKTHILSFNWRHFLNAEEIFFGADDLYYDFIYDLAFDSENVFSHHLKVELHKDVNKSFNINLKVGITFSDNNIYEDKNLILSFKIYF